MTLLEKLDKIFLEKRLKTIDFLEQTGISKTAYYAIKNGKTKKISVDNAKKIAATFKEYSYEWLVGIDTDTSIFSINAETSGTIKTSIGEVSVKEFAYLAGQNFSKLENESIFYNAVLVKALNILKQASDADGNINITKLNTKN